MNSVYVYTCQKNGCYCTDGCMISNCIFILAWGEWYHRVSGGRGKKLLLLNSG